MESKTTDGPRNRDPIGTATMKSDGTIVLALRAEGTDGLVGHGAFEYPPSDPAYAEVLAHLGGLEVGEHKRVLPWPDRR